MVARVACWLKGRVGWVARFCNKTRWPGGLVATLTTGGLRRCLWGGKVAKGGQVASNTEIWETRWQRWPGGLRR